MIAQGALHRHAADGPVLELRAEVAVGHRVAVLVEDAQADQQAALGIAGSAGGWARPSRKWHDEHDWALKSGPSPSRPSVEAGAVTQLSLKKLLPTAKSRRCWLSRPGTGWAKAPLPGDLDGGVTTLVGQLLVGGRRRRARRLAIVAAREQEQGGGGRQAKEGRPPHRWLDLQADRVAEVAGQRGDRRRPGPGGW